MKYDPNVYGYVNGKPTYSRDEFIFTVRGFGPIENDADLLAFAEKVTSRWYNAGWHQTFATYYLWADNSVEEIWIGKNGATKSIMTVGPHGDAC